MNENPNRVPNRVEPFGPKDMLLAWNTGETVRVPYFELRFLCPCANCVDEVTGQRTLQRSAISEDVRPVNVNLVGQYAIKIEWSDGHSTGMYAFDSLFQICQRAGAPLEEHNNA